MVRWPEGVDALEWTFILVQLLDPEDLSSALHELPEHAHKGVRKGVEVDVEFSV